MKKKCKKRSFAKIFWYGPDEESVTGIIFVLLTMSVIMFIIFIIPLVAFLITGDIIVTGVGNNLLIMRWCIISTAALWLLAVVVFYICVFIRAMRCGLR